VAAAREAAGHGESDAFAASEMPRGRSYDVAVALSRSGTTSEVLDLVEQLSGTPVLAITADGGSPLAAAATRAVVMEFADEQSVVQTRFATCTVALFRALLGERLDAAIADARDALAAPVPVDVEAVGQIVFLGRGWTVGLAYEAALKVREAAQAWSEAYPAMEYRHGPISVAAPGTVVWALSALPHGLDGEVRATGASLVTPVGDPLAELVRAQGLAVALAQARGLDPDRPRNLTRSVVLDGGAGGG
jgi:fructoselysine-6-P-deglycase FrlB-like protein